MTRPLLTIVVPTYNRAKSLELLLLSLRSELQSLSSDCCVIVSDNASTDDTQASLKRLQMTWPELSVSRNSTNIGADSNFLACIPLVKSRYCWFISDDDVPKQGVVSKMLTLLKELSPTLVYMQSEWLAHLTTCLQGEQISRIDAEIMSSADFLGRTHVMLTFISGVIFDLDALKASAYWKSYDRYKDTCLVQLGWVLPLLMNEAGRFVFVPQQCMLATANNSGGYPLLSVFGTEFPQIANSVFGEDSLLARLAIRGNILYYLPILIWGQRVEPSKKHEMEIDPWTSMSSSLDKYLLYNLLLFPIGRSPRWFAYLLFQAWRVFCRISRYVQRLRGERLIEHYVF